MIAIAHSLATPAGKVWAHFRHVFLGVVTVLAKAWTRRTQIEIDRYLRIRRSFEGKECGSLH
jgi:hypothetical protein